MFYYTWGTIGGGDQGVDNILFKVVPVENMPFGTRKNYSKLYTKTDVFYS